MIVWFYIKVFFLRSYGVRSQNYSVVLFNLLSMRKPWN